MSKRLLLNSLSGVFLFIVTIVVTFIMSPVIIRSLGNRDYGFWEIVMSVVGYMGLLDLGIGPALLRFISVAHGKEDREDLQQTISTAFAFFLVIGLVVLLLFFLLSYFPEVIAGKAKQDMANLSTVFVLVGLNALVLFPMQVVTTALMGIQRHYLYNGIKIVFRVVDAVLAYYLLSQYPGKGLVVLAVVAPCINLVQFIIFAGVVYHDKSIPNINFSAVKYSKLRELFVFGIKSLTTMTASRIQNQSVPIIIGHVIGLGHVVYFAIPNRLIDYGKNISQVIGIPLTPYFGSSFGKGENDYLLKSWLNTSLALQAIGLAIPLVIFFCGEIFISLWIGHEYASAGHWVINFLLIGLVADSFAGNSFRMLTVQSKHGMYAIVWLVLSLLSIPVGIWGASQWGIAGVALGTTLVTAVGSLVSVFMACSLMQISLKTYFKETVFPLIIPLLLLLIAFMIMNRFFAVKGYVMLSVQVFVAGIIYCIAIWQFTLSGDIKERLKTNFYQRFVTQQ